MPCGIGDDGPNSSVHCTYVVPPAFAATREVAGTQALQLDAQTRLKSAPGSRLSGEGARNTVVSTAAASASHPRHVFPSQAWAGGRQVISRVLIPVGSGMAAPSPHVVLNFRSEDKVVRLPSRGGTWPSVAVWEVRWDACHDRFDVMLDAIAIHEHAEELRRSSNRQAAD